MPPLGAHWPQAITISFHQARSKSLLYVPGKKSLLTISRMDCAVLQGTVDFSTTILLSEATFAIVLVAASTYPKSAAAPFPMPFVLVGVLTHTKMSSASSIALSMSVEKKRFGDCCS